MATRTEDSDLRDTPGVGRAPPLQANGNLVDHSMAMGATTASQRAVVKAAEDFLEHLTVRMRRMDRPPQATFRHSYGGEFEHVMNADRVSITEYEILYKAALAEENVPRNRYSNVLANEHSRVRLSDIAVAAAQATQGTAVDRSRGFGGLASIPSDYINANRITGVAPTRATLRRRRRSGRPPPTFGTWSSMRRCPSLLC
eukprot:TRINITY_DN793_c0_g1_i15.p4 TRINITY_DN793_c0_g1~~TRINITY_DN793_c0_g1_i15.p4  ORF type:complete len:200 (+),score=36.07 TRINITY_DN793_c0_g1_i15:945-1544(+)